MGAQCEGARGKSPDATATEVDAEHQMMPKQRAPNGRKVFLNVYDLLLMNYTTSKYGVGIYHTGVQLDNKEYSYAAHNKEHTGLRETKPRDSSCVEDAIYKESILIGWTYVSDETVANHFASLKHSYLGDEYNPLKRNCNHFTEEFLDLLVEPHDRWLRDGESPIPAYVNRVVYVANKVRPCLPSVLTTDLREQQGKGPRPAPPPRALPIAPLPIAIAAQPSPTSAAAATIASAAVAADADSMPPPTPLHARHSHVQRAAAHDHHAHHAGSTSIVPIAVT